MRFLTRSKAGKLFAGFQVRGETVGGLVSPRQAEAMAAELTRAAARLRNAAKQARSRKPSLLRRLTGRS